MTLPPQAEAPTYKPGLALQNEFVTRRDAEDRLQAPFDVIVRRPPRRTVDTHRPVFAASAAGAASRALARDCIPSDARGADHAASAS